MAKDRGSKFLKLLDYWIGIPLIWCLSHCRKRKTPPSNQRVGFLKLAGIGDVVLLARSITAYQKKFPDQTLIFFTTKSLKEIAEYLPVDTVVTLSVFHPWETIRLLRSYSLDLLFDCEAWSRISALFAFFSGAKWTQGFQTEAQARHFAFDTTVPHSFEIHEEKNFAHLLGVEPISCHWRTFSPPPLKKIIVLHACPAGSYIAMKRWPKEYWRLIAQNLSHYELYATGSAHDASYVEDVFKDLNVKNMAGKLPLKKTIELLQSACCVVSVNTGIMHLAASLEVPTIGLHGPTDPKRWGPIGPQGYALIGQKEHTPCMQLGFETPCSLCDCIHKIPPEKVLAQIESILLQSP